MIIEPRSYFTLFRGLENHLDATTYYVRAIIRDGQTSTLLDTVDLTDNGDREFSKQWQAPHDPNGTGRYITITYSVYTDSGYSTKSENYGDRYEEHEVKHRPEDVRMPSGGDEVNYGKIQKIIDNALANFKPVNVKNETVNVTTQQISVDPILKAIADKDISMEPVMQEMATLKMGVAELQRRAPFEKTDLVDVLEKLQEIADGLEEKTNGINKQNSTLLEGIKKELVNKISEVLDFAKNINYIIPNKFDDLKEKDNKKEDFISKANQMADGGANE